MLNSRAHTPRELERRTNCWAATASPHVTGAAKRSRLRGLDLGSSASPRDRSAMPDVVEPEPEHPQPDVVLGQVHQLAASADPGQHKSPLAGHSFEPRSSSEFSKWSLTSNRDGSARDIARARRASARPNSSPPRLQQSWIPSCSGTHATGPPRGLLNPPRSTPRSGSARVWPRVLASPSAGLDLRPVLLERIWARPPVAWLLRRKAA